MQDEKKKEEKSVYQACKSIFLQHSKENVAQLCEYSVVDLHSLAL